MLLLDEIEKAHPDLFNILLQIMDHGKLTDHNGKQIDFRNVILIMTTNAGAADLAKQAFGFTRTKREGDDHEAINRLFAPEFRNRLDAVISFGHLPKEVVAKVVDKFVLQLEAQLADRNVTIELSDEARAWLVEHGYDETMGARPMARLIQATIKTPLADEVLFGKLKGGGAVRVVVVKDEEAAKEGKVKEKLGFEFPEGPVAPKPEKEIEQAAKRAKRKPRSGGGSGAPRTSSSRRRGKPKASSAGRMAAISTSWRSPSCAPCRRCRSRKSEEANKRVASRIEFHRLSAYCSPLRLLLVLATPVTTEYCRASCAAVPPASSAAWQVRARCGAGSSAA